MSTEPSEEAPWSLTPPTVVVVGIDESDHSYHALEWTLDHLISPATAAAIPNSKLVVVYAKPNPASVVIDLGSAELMETVDADLKKLAKSVVDRVRNLCFSKSVRDVLVEVVEGDARNVLHKAVEKHNADILVVGSHGYGTFKRVLLGSERLLYPSSSMQCDDSEKYK